MAQLLDNKKISEIAQKQVIASLREILSDPDGELELSSNMIKKINKSLKAKRAGKTRDLSDVLAKY